MFLFIDQYLRSIISEDPEMFKQINTISKHVRQNGIDSRKFTTLKKQVVPLHPSYMKYGLKRYVTLTI